jgi:hypothetical protein
MDNSEIEKQKIKKNIILTFYIILFYILLSHPLFIKIFSILCESLFSHNILLNFYDNQSIYQFNLFGQFIVGCIFAILILIFI